MEQCKSHSGLSLDLIGFGTYRIDPGEATYAAVSKALELGYCSIDTAKFYENEQDVGKAVRASGIDVQITTKVWNDEQGYQSALDAGRRSRDYLLVDSIDLLLLHWPGGAGGKMLETWNAFEKLKEEGTVRHIGVSNFKVSHLSILEEKGLSCPSANQIELNPQLTQEDVRLYCNNKGIIVEAWGPLVSGHLQEIASHINPIASSYNKTVAQVVLRWAIQQNIRVLPKSINEQRMKENINIFDFELSTQEIDTISALNKNKRIGPDPDEFVF